MLRYLALAASVILFVSSGAPAAGAVVSGGKTEGVFYGWSPVLDLWGNVRRSVWTLRRDGVLYFGAPEGSFEGFAARPLTAAEKAESGTYSIAGDKFTFTYRDGSPGEGQVFYAADGKIEKIKASTLNFLPVGPLSFPLAGYFSCTVSFNNAAYGMSTTAYSCYSFYEGGGFVLESGSGTTIRSAGSYEALRDQIIGYYGTEGRARVGRFTVEGSGLSLALEDGTKRSLYIGEIGRFEDGSVMLLIGRSLCEGTPGRFPGDPVTVTAEQFTLALPTGWTSEAKDLEGQRVYMLSPGGEDPGIAILALGVDGDPAAKANDPQTIAALRALVSAWIGADLASAGEAEPLAMDGADAVRIPMRVTMNGTAMRVDGVYAVRDGRAVLLVALGREEAAAARAAEIRSILVSLRLAVDATVKTGTADFEVSAPRDWTATTAAQPGSTTLTLVPPGVKDGDFFLVLAGQAAAGVTMEGPSGAAWLRAQVEGAIPGLAAQGEPQYLRVDGEPAVAMQFAAQTLEGQPILVWAAAVAKHGKVVLMLLGGKKDLVERIAAAAHRVFLTVTVRR